MQNPTWRRFPWLLVRAELADPSEIEVYHIRNRTIKATTPPFPYHGNYSRIPHNSDFFTLHDQADHRASSDHHQIFSCIIRARSDSRCPSPVTPSWSTPMIALAISVQCSLEFRLCQRSSLPSSNPQDAHDILVHGENDAKHIGAFSEE